MIRREILGLAAAAAALPCARLSAQAAAAAIPAPRPIEDLAALPFMEGPRLSPGGTRVASRIAVSGKLYFAVSSLFGEPKPSLFQTGDGDINWWRWVNDEWLVLGLGDTVKVQGEDFYVRDGRSVLRGLCGDARGAARRGAAQMRGLLRRRLRHAGPAPLRPPLPQSVEYVEQPEGDHHFSRQADRLHFLTELEAFLKRHNPA